MKNNIINVAVTLFFLLTLGAATGQAQTSNNQFRSYIPFQFNVGERKLLRSATAHVPLPTETAPV